MKKINATALATLLGVRVENISRWHRRKLIVGTKSTGDRRSVMFDLKKVRSAVIKHDLLCGSDALKKIDTLLAMDLELTAN